MSLTPSPVLNDARKLGKAICRLGVRVLCALVVGLGLWLAITERELRSMRGSCHPMTPQNCARWLALTSPRLIYEDSQGGNKSYLVLELRDADAVLFRFWGAHSLFRQPSIEVGPGYLLTYQPEIDPPDTPLGNVCPGWIQWNWDGKTFTLGGSTCPGSIAGCVTR